MYTSSSRALPHFPPAAAAGDIVAASRSRHSHGQPCRSVEAQVHTPGPDGEGKYSTVAAALHVACFSSCDFSI
jgi:hypothetical protein